MHSPTKIFLIIDGHALLHRAWHALPPLTAPDGRVVHGAYGFTTILLNAIKKFQPAYVAVTFDLAGPTFRHLDYKEYKATREKKPDELYGQVEYLRNILAAMEVPVFDKEGFEADDVIGTLSDKAESRPGVHTVIVTGDHDTLQLVDENTSVFTMRKGMADTITYDPGAVRERYQFDPVQLIDYKALRGDASDNIPGVKGIGEKTATDLIKEFGTIPELYKSLDANDERAKALKSGVREKLIAHRADAMQAYDLCRIRRDVPIDFDLEKCAYRPPTRARMQDVFTEYGFMKLLAQLPAQDGLDMTTTSIVASDAVLMPRKKEIVIPASSSVIPASLTVIPAQAGIQEDENILIIKDKKDFLSAITEVAKENTFAFRIIPATTDPLDIIPAYLGLATKKKSYIIDGTLVTANASELKELFSSDAVKVCHDLRDEIKALISLGITLSGPSFDLLVASYILSSGERRHALDALLAYRLGMQFEGDASPLAALDRALPHMLPLADEIGTELESMDLTKVCTDIETPLSAVIARMEREGIELDVPYMKKLSTKVGKEIDTLVAKIHEYAGAEFNVNSPTQLKKVLFEDLAISSQGLKKTAKGGTLSTAAAELEKLRNEHPIVQAVLDYRELAKLKSTYIDTLPELVHPRTGRIHAKFNQAVAATGRLSSSDPNLQNIPTAETDYGKQVRDGFVAKQGTILLAADYSQFELRIAAHMAHEQVMIDAFKNGEDIHQRTAIVMFGEEEAPHKRRIAKAINFGILYGMGATRLSETVGISFSDAKAYIAKYFEAHPAIAAFIKEEKRKMIEEGCVQTLLGRKRCFPNYKVMDKREQAEAERQAVNMPVQGTQADIIKLAMISLDKVIAERFAGKVAMLIQVHDELVFEVQEDTLEEFLPIARDIMESAYPLKVPVQVNCSTGPRWGTMKK